MLNSLMPAALVAAGTLTLGVAYANADAPPKHGGIVRSSEKLTFELVRHPDGADLYVADSGAALSTKNLGGLLWVQNASVQFEAVLRPAGGNKLEARGVKIAAGDKVVAQLTTADGQPRTVRFVAK